MNRILRKQYRIRAPLYRVWRYFQDGVGLSSWFSERGTLFEPWVGGNLKIYFSDHEIGEGIVTAFVPGKTFAFQWQSGGSFGAPFAKTTVTIEVSEEVREESSPITSIRLTETGFGDGNDWSEYYAQTYAGWTYYLLNLKSVAETGFDLRS